MEGYQHRVFIERGDLAGRIARLRAFIESGRVPPEAAEGLRLARQLFAMSTYLAILDERITAFTAG